MLLWTLLAALALAGVNALPHAIRRLSASPRARFLSFASGVTMGFVFLRLLPAFVREEEVVLRAGVNLPLPVGENVYGVALFSLLVFYGAELLGRRPPPPPRMEGTSWRFRALTPFGVEMTSFALLDFMIGFTLLHRARAGGHELLFFFTAMFLKFFVTDHALHAQHADAYDRVGRWVLTAAVLAGWALGVAVRLPDIWPALVEAFIAGGVIFNILSWELPHDRRSRYWPFLLGAVTYAVLQVVV